MEDDEETSVEEGLFSTPGFVKFIIPKLKQVFRVLDVQIRLTLLEHFHLYVNAFTKEELMDDILPQLLLGIKDTNDLLVTKTLLCLAELIPILGASQVIGKNRKKLFADGRPQQTETWNSDQPRSITPVISASMDMLLSSSPVNTSAYPTEYQVISPEPNMREINRRGSSFVNNANEDEEEWSWDHDEQKNGDENSREIITTEDILLVNENLEKLVIETKSTEPQNRIIEKNMTRPKVNDNIDELDIKNQKLPKPESAEVDFFSDFGMSPQINPYAVVAEIDNNSTLNESVVNRLLMTTTDADDGWGDEDEWNNHDEVL